MPGIVNGVDYDTALNIAKKFLPDYSRSEVAIESPGEGPGFWVGAPCAAEYNGYIFLAYRLRYPVELGRGQGVIIARSKDGVHFNTITMIPKDAMDAESLERPTLIRTPENKWRLYLSCSTAGSKHWRVEVLEADNPAALNPNTRKTVLPGDDNWGVKDTVITIKDGVWHLWATMHPLDIKGEEDRMITKYATSSDGMVWNWSDGIALEPRKGIWDQRGTRVTAVHFDKNMVIAYYDGRISAAENFEERTGIAVGTKPEHFVAIGDAPFAQSPKETGLRYMDLLQLENGSYRIYYEVATDDDSHELRTELIS